MFAFVVFNLDSMSLDFIVLFWEVQPLLFHNQESNFGIDLVKMMRLLWSGMVASGAVGLGPPGAQESALPPVDQSLKDTVQSTSRHITVV